MAHAYRSTKNSEIMFTHCISMQAHLEVTQYCIAHMHVSLSVLTCHKLPPLILCERVIVNCMNWELLAMRNIDCPVCFNLSMIT